MKQDAWNPTHYNKFKIQRSQPFYDLLGRIKKDRILSAVDLGCGTGELTQVLCESLPKARVLGVDNSPAMLEESARYAGSRLSFQNQDISSFARETSGETYDLIFTNAALQWVSDHCVLIPQLLHRVKAGGQIAIQVPYNWDHVSHQLAYKVASEFQTSVEIPSRELLDPEQYSRILYENGFVEPRVSVEVYPHPMKSGADVYEWTRGTLLTFYKNLLAPNDYESFLLTYKERLVQELGDRPYLYTFKRLLIWGERQS